MPVAGPAAAGHGTARSVGEGVPGNHSSGVRAVAVLFRYVLTHDRYPARTPRGNPGHGLLRPDQLVPAGPADFQPLGVHLGQARSGEVHCRAADVHRTLRPRRAPLVLGDLKGEHVKAVKALNGQVIRLGRGVGYLNILDPGQAVEAAQILEDNGHHEDAARVRADAHGRRLTMVVSLITISRNSPPTDQEQTILDRALRILDERFDGVPVLKDLLDVIVSAPDELRQVALDRGDMNIYLQETRALEATLLGLTGGGKLGEIFSRQTSEPMVRDRAVVFDVSSIDETETDLQAAVLLACWSYGFGTVNVANALADAELEPRRNYFVVLDELWRALRAGKAWWTGWTP